LLWWSTTLTYEWKHALLYLPWIVRISASVSAFFCWIVDHEEATFAAPDRYA
jgi:hypothetical protein